MPVYWTFISPPTEIESETISLACRSHQPYSRLERRSIPLTQNTLPGSASSVPRERASTAVNKHQGIPLSCALLLWAPLSSVEVTTVPSATLNLSLKWLSPIPGSCFNSISPNRFRKAEILAGLPWHRNHLQASPRLGSPQNCHRGHQGRGRRRHHPHRRPRHRNQQPFCNLLPCQDQPPFQRR